LPPRGAPSPRITDRGGGGASQGSFTTITTILTTTTIFTTTILTTTILTTTVFTAALLHHNFLAVLRRHPHTTTYTTYTTYSPPGLSSLRRA